MALKLLLVRHGQASFGQSNYDVLSPLGAQQAEVLGAHWASLGIRPDMLFTGRMARQIDTATGLQLAVPPTRLSGLDEFDAEALFKAYLPQVLQNDPSLPRNGREIFADRRQFQRAFEAVLTHWIPAAEVPDPITETWTAFCQRVVDALAEMVDQCADTPDAVVAAVSSGGPISVAVRHALQLSDAATFHVNWRIYNASVTELRLRRGADGSVQASLIGFNDVSHLRLAERARPAGETLLTHR